MNSRTHWLVIIFSTIISLVGIPAASAATLYLSPGTKTATVGATITVDVKVDTAGQAINDAQATIVFPVDQLEFKSLSTTNSIFTHWTVKPSGSNDTGRVVFAGGLPTPGYTGAAGAIVTTTWKAKKAGTANITITDGQVLANDGQGTDVLTGVDNGTYTIVTAPPPPAPVISSPTHSDQNRWYQTPQAVLEWTRLAGVTAVSYLLDQRPDTVPDEVSEKNTDTVTVTFPRDGTWYFHLRIGQDANWSQAGHFRLHYDQTPPDPFTLELIRDRSESDPTPQIAFAAADATSGLDHYTLSLDQRPPAPAVTPVILTLTKPGDHQVSIVAYDRAGNSRLSQITFTSVGYPAPTVTSISSPLILLQPLIMKGLATAGDTLTISIDGQPVGQVVVGQIQTAAAAAFIRLPWTWQSDRVFGPGSHQVTVTATGADGLISVPTDPRTFDVSGATITFLGRPVATVAVAPAVGLVLLILLVALVYVMIKLGRSAIRLHREEVFVEVAVETMRRQIVEGGISASQLERELEILDQDLKHPERMVKRKRRSGPTR